MKIEMRPTNSVKPYDHNPRDNDDAVEAVARSIKEFGFRQPIVVDTEDVIVVGHTRHRAALLLELAEVPVHVAADLSPAKLKAYRIADNKTGELATWNSNTLASELVDLRELADVPDADFDMEALGFGDDELEELIGDDGDGGEPDAVPETPEEPTAKRGDLWILGGHRLLCGDATEEDDVARLLDGAAAGLTMTSPPYWVGKEYEREKSWEEVLSFIDNVTATMVSVTRDNGRIVINTGTANVHQFHGACEYTLLLDEWQRCLRRHGWLMRHARIWAKAGGLPFVGPQSDVVDMHWEFIATFYKPHKPFVGQRRVGDVSWPNQGVWAGIKGNANQKGHCASFPVEIPNRNIQLYSDKDEIIYEPFAGAGTTIIAAEQLGRRCFAIEIEPRYVDVCVKRWEKFTGREAHIAPVDAPRSGG